MRKNLRQFVHRKLSRHEKHRHLIRHLQVHERKKISRRTLFYLREYGPQSHVSSVIIRESIKILILASILSTIGGLGLQSIEAKLYTVIPLLIMLPALNDMIGDFGTVVSSKFTTLLYLGKIGKKWWRDEGIRALLRNVTIIALISAVYIGILSYVIAMAMGFVFSYALLLKVVGIAVVAVLLLVSVIFILSVVGGIYIYRKKEDPDNFLIPITTSVADLGSMIILSLLTLALL